MFQNPQTKICPRVENVSIPSPPPLVVYYSHYFKIASFAKVADKNNVKYLIQKGFTYSQITIYYQSLHPNATGMSSRGATRYCNEKNINRLTDEAVQILVTDVITSYGLIYGIQYAS